MRSRLDIMTSGGKRGCPPVVSGVSPVGARAARWTPADTSNRRSAMRKATTLFVGLDVHKDFIRVAHAEAHRTDPPVFVGSIGSAQADIDKLVRRLHSTTAQLVFAYEAGPSAYV